MTASLTVAQAGLATLQDLGRTGLGHLGVPSGGAADAHAARTANTLVGNAPGARVVEITGSALSVTFHNDALVAVTGAAERVLIDSIPTSAWDAVVVGAGRIMTIEAPMSGWRSYLAVNGEFVNRTGDRLLTGDVLTLQTRFTSITQPWLGLPLFRLGANHTPTSPSAAIEVTAGPEAGQFDSDPHDLLPGRFEVSSQSDHVGLRLLGQAPHRHESTEILSRGVPIGAVEAPPGGGLLVLGRSRLLTAGYPVIAVATSLAVDRLAQVRPGDRLAFTLCSVAQAHRQLRQRHERQRALAARVAAAFSELGHRDLIDNQHLSRDDI